MAETVSGSRLIRRPLTVAVEGNIGSGKSTFLDYCRHKPGIGVYPEPVEQWRNVNGVNLLANFYGDPHRWAMAFQLYVGETQLAIYKQKTWKRMKVVERSLLSSRNCFMDNMRRNGVLDGTSAYILEKWYDRNIDHKTTPHCIVYIRTSPAVSYNRMVQRARGEETTVSMAYIMELHNLHESWIVRMQAANLSGDADIPIFTIEADVPELQLIHKYNECLENLELLNM